MTAPTNGAEPGVVGPWLAGELGDEAWREPAVALISGGKSNLTYVVSSPAGEVVLRRPPTGHILPTAHDMIRESTVIAALFPTGFPVPEVLAVERTGDVLGQPFYVMTKVDGYIVKAELPAGFAATEPERQALSVGLVDTLAALHAVDIEQAGLDGFGRPEGYLARQVARWAKQSAASGGEDVPGLPELTAALAADVPAHSDATVVHGDFRMDNCVLDPERPGSIRAVLDWEMSTLGDPLADLGLLLCYWSSAEEDRAIAGITPTVTDLPGFLTRRQVADLYADRTGRDLDRLPFYVAFAYYKLAIVVQGVIARLRAGAMGGQDFGPMDGLVPVLIERGRGYLADGTIG